MYLSAERLAIANRAITETFEQTCVAWQVIPHWDTGDPAQTWVPDGNLKTPKFTAILPLHEDVDLTLAEAISPTPDSLLAKVMAITVKLAVAVDDAVFPAVRIFPGVPSVPWNAATPDDIMDALLDARAKVEDGGYRAPSCLVTDLGGVKVLNKLVSGYYSVKQSLLDASYVNSLHRVGKLKDLTKAGDTAQGLFFGRRQRIAHGGATDASPGEEPVDLAVSVSPSLEVIGDTQANMIKLSVRIRYATRVKDESGVVVILGP